MKDDLHPLHHFFATTVGKFDIIRSLWNAEKLPESHQIVVI